MCLHFHAPVRVGRFRVTDLYLAVDDLAGLGAALSARGIGGWIYAPAIDRGVGGHAVAGMAISR